MLSKIHQTYFTNKIAKCEVYNEVYRPRYLILFQSSNPQIYFIKSIIGNV